MLQHITAYYSITPNTESIQTSNTLHSYVPTHWFRNFDSTGVAARYVGEVFWALINSDALVVRNGRDPETCREAGVCELLGIILQSYKPRAIDKPSRINNLTLGMLKKGKHPCFCGKGAETRALVQVATPGILAGYSVHRRTGYSHSQSQLG